MLLSETLSTQILKSLTGNGTKPSTSASVGAATSVPIGAYLSCYIGLSTADPTTDGSGFSEPATSKGYKRLECHELMSTTYKSYAKNETEDTAHTRRIGNKDELSFHEACLIDNPDSETGADWGKITHIGLFTSESGGTPYAWCKLDNENGVTISTHQKFIFRAGHFELYLDGDEVAVAANGANS